jgi:isopentenyl diphosphate isomerase/L-lactate dehydrogenase-like FMN-dependent dehydrogenase
MKPHSPRLDDRRRFLRFLAKSPLLAGIGLGLAPRRVDAATSAGQEVSAHPVDFLKAMGEKPIASPKDAESVFDFELVARNTLPPAHYGYLATGVDDDRTLAANREALTRIQIRARHLVDVSKVDISTEILGQRWESPIVIAPTGSQKAFHPEGEIAVARAARAKNHLQILSTVTTSSVEEVTKARGAPVWYQLYPTPLWRVTEALVRRAEAAGCPVIALTVDLPIGPNRETARRFARVDDRDCTLCHDNSTFATSLRNKPMFDGIDLAGVEDNIHLGQNWDFVKRLRDLVKVKLFLKGIVTEEDAALAAENGVDGVIVSNHGGRSEASNRATIDCLPEVVKAVSGRIPVLVDSGFRRGSDVFKALALGARAVCIGRPYLWGLASFGQEGVEAVLQILRAELAEIMETAGTPSLRDITPRSVVLP